MTPTGLTQKRLVELLECDPVAGVLTWKVATSNRGAPGREAGSFDGKGYKRCKVDGRVYRYHHLVWMYVHGQMPTGHLDHINGIKTDNRISNLREATISQNMWNARMCKRNTSGYKGVSFHAGKWVARVVAHGRKTYLGRFASREEAYAAYCQAAQEIHGEFARVE